MPDPAVPQQFSFQLPNAPGGGWPPISGGAVGESPPSGTSTASVSWVTAYMWEVD